MMRAQTSQAVWCEGLAKGRMKRKEFGDQTKRRRKHKFASRPFRLRPKVARRPFKRLY